MVIVSAWLDYFPNRLSDVKLRYSCSVFADCPYKDPFSILHVLAAFFFIQKGEITGAPPCMCAPTNGLLFITLLLTHSCQRSSSYLNSIPGDSLRAEWCIYHCHCAPLHTLPQ